MKKLLALALMVPVVALALTAPPKVHKWQDAEPSVGPRPDFPADRATTVVMVDTFTTYIRYLFEHQQALVLPADDAYWFYWAYNDGYSHVRTKVFTEDQIMDPGSWIEQDIFEWTGDGTLRYIAPSAYFDGSFWYPEVSFNCHAPSANWYQLDEGGLGSGIWSNPYDLLDGRQYDQYLPLPWAGTNNVVYIDGQARDTADDSHVFQSIDGWTSALIDPPGEVMIFGADPSYDPVNYMYGQGYENSQLVAAADPAGDRVVVAGGGYTDSLYTQLPLTIVYRESNDGGMTWNDAVWVDQAVCPDMPGSMPGIDGHYSNSFLDLLIEEDGDLHFLVVIADSGYFGNAYPESEILGLYDVHQENGDWTATLVCDGTYMVDGEPWFPGDLHVDPAGDILMHSPSLSIHPDGVIFAAWNDVAEHDDADTTSSLGIWTCASQDGGMTWTEPWMMTNTEVDDEYFSRLTYCTTQENVYCITMYGAGGVNGPLYLLQVPVADYDLSGVEDTPVPEVAVLGDVAPNPFSNEVSVNLSLVKPTKVDAKVYNVNGELVQTIHSGSMDAGDHQLVFDGRNAAAGVYFMQVDAGGQTMSARMVLVK
jgi:hypothetical protein